MATGPGAASLEADLDMLADLLHAVVHVGAGVRSSCRAADSRLLAHLSARRI
ncbi:MAG: hypothetical protein ABW318_10895 [Vicinamibacterales bacterium]